MYRSTWVDLAMALLYNRPARLIDNQGEIKLFPVKALRQLDTTNTKIGKIGYVYLYFGDHKRVMVKIEKVNDNTI